MLYFRCEFLYTPSPPTFFCIGANFALAHSQLRPIRVQTVYIYTRVYMYKQNGVTLVGASEKIVFKHSSLWLASACTPPLHHAHTRTASVDIVGDEQPKNKRRLVVRKNFW